MGIDHSPRIVRHLRVWITIHKRASLVWDLERSLPAPFSKPHILSPFNSRMRKMCLLLPCRIIENEACRHRPPNPLNTILPLLCGPPCRFPTTIHPIRYTLGKETSTVEHTSPAEAYHVRKPIMRMPPSIVSIRRGRPASKTTRYVRVFDRL